MSRQRRPTFYAEIRLTERQAEEFLAALDNEMAGREQAEEIARITSSRRKRDLYALWELRRRLLVAQLNAEASRRRIYPG